MEKKPRVRKQKCIGKKGQYIKIGYVSEWVWGPCRRFGRKEVLVPKSFFEKGAEGYVRVKLCSDCAKPFEVGERKS